MTIHITPHMIEGAYSLLRVSPPFNRWKLPDPDDIEFRVVGAKDAYGWVQGDKVLAISSNTVGHLSTLIEKVAHEIVHIRLHRVGKGHLEHGPDFQKLAEQVCRVHGFDVRAF